MPASMNEQNPVLTSAAVSKICLILLVRCPGVTLLHLPDPTFSYKICSRMSFWTSDKDAPHQSGG